MDMSPLWISLRIAFYASVITFFLGCYIAFKCKNTYNEKNSINMVSRILDVLFTIPLVLPPTVAGLILLILFGKNGIFGKPLSYLGIQVIFTKTAAVMAAIFVSFPLMYRSAKAAFEQVDQNLIEAGRTLGMSEGRIFRKIIMPIASPGVTSGIILSFARALGEFGATLMVAGNIPKVTQTMPLAIYMNLQGGDFKVSLLWGAILIAFSFAMILCMNFITNSKSNRRSSNYEFIRQYKEGL